MIEIWHPWKHFSGTRMTVAAVFRQQTGCCPLLTKQSQLSKSQPNVHDSYRSKLAVTALSTE